MIKLIAILFILLSFDVVIAAEKKNDVLKILIQSPLVINKTKVAQGKIVSLSSLAIKAGYDEIKLKGSVAYKRLPNKQTRVKINWITLRKQEGTRELTTQIKGGLLSQFIISSKRLDAGEEISARGDLETLSESLDSTLKQSANAGNNSATEESDNTGTKEAPQKSQPVAANINTAGTPDTSGYGGETGSPQDAAGSGAALRITTYEACVPRIDKIQGIVYEQSQRVETLETGTELTRTACADKGANAPIVKTYETCGITPDIVGGFVYKKYKEEATLNGVTIPVTDCSTDFNFKFDVRKDTESCGVRHDFINSVSILLEQNYYIDASNTRIDLGDCTDSVYSFAHYLTYNTCEAVIDEPNSLVFPQKRTAYNITNGTVKYASACAPVDSEQVPLQTEVCAQKYEHDFAVGQSYKRNQKFYNDGQTGEKILIGGCTRDTTVSFPHLNETASCTVSYDDANLQNIWRANTYIDVTSEGDGIIELAPCADFGNPTPYLAWDEGYKLTASSTVGIKTSPFNSWFDAGNGYTQVTQCPPSNTWADGSAVNSVYFSLIYPTSTSSIYDTFTDCVLSSTSIPAIRGTWGYFKRYKRADNSYYDFSTGEMNNTGTVPLPTTRLLN